MENHVRYRSWISRSAVAAFAALLMLLGLAGPAAPALANPATTARYAAGASATIYSGKAFDTCTAPAVTTITAWSSSPYRALAVYIGGVDRHCTQPLLTGTWVSTVTAQGWRLIPVYKGLQAPCGNSEHKISPAKASSQGTAAAEDAVAEARALGMVGGSAIYNDMEYYPTGDASCRTAVLTFLSGWTTEIHRLGYVAGVYAQLYSGGADLAGAYASALYARPDALWIARYDQNPNLTGWASVSDAYWTQHQRAKQYTGGHNETYGGVTLNIDNDQVDAPVATVGYTYQVVSTRTLSSHSGPANRYPVTKTYGRGSALTVSCQTPGQKVRTTRIWDKMTNGSYVTDYYVSTASNTGYSSPLTRCKYPFQVTAAGGVSERIGPGSSYRATGTLAGGSLAWITCQRAGSKVGTTSVWDNMTNGRWITDYYVSTFNKKTYSLPIPRC